MVEQAIRIKVVTTCKVKQNPYKEEVTTQGRGEDSMVKYPYLFDHHLLNLEDEIHLKGVEL
jgi:hypothetical protein